MVENPITVTPAEARALWLGAQRLDVAAPFGGGPQAAAAAIAHLGYVQIDTINVIERCHHHILYSRIPDYARADLAYLQSTEKSIFEYWTHALSYVPLADLAFFLPAMRAYRADPHAWYGAIAKEDIAAMLGRLAEEGPLSIRDIADDKLVEKTHPWASRKPSKRVLQALFFQGRVVVSARAGMLKTYDLIERHFGWDKPPRAASPRQITAYLLERSLRSQGLVSLESICHLKASAKKSVAEMIEARVTRRQLRPVRIAGAENQPHWVRPESLEARRPALARQGRVHILSPFDPLIIQRKRLKLFFGYEHLFEAYVPAAKRRMGYFTLPVLIDDKVMAAIDLKTDRQAGKLLVQNWTWIEQAGSAEKAAIEAELGRFERFQLAQ